MTDLESIRRSSCISMLDETPSHPENDDRLQQLEIDGMKSNTVNRLRLVVIVALIFAAAIICTLIYLLTLGVEESQFENQFDGVAEQIMTAFDRIATEKLGAVGALRVSAMAEAINYNSSWPFVTMSSFEKRAAAALRLSGSVFLGIYPIVNSSNRAEWEKYTAEAGPTWIRDSLRYQSKVGTEVFGQTASTYNSSLAEIPITFLNRTSQTEYQDGPGPYLPLWQSSPVLTYLVNNDAAVFPVLGEEFLKASKASSALFGTFLAPEPGGVDSPNGQTRYYAGFVSSVAQKYVEIEGDPFSHVYLPIFGSFDEQDNVTVAVIMAIIHWKSHFRNILSSSEKDVAVVLENPCDGQFTYIIRGGDPIFIGKGDLHQSKFDDMKRRTSFETLTVLEDGTEQGIPLMSDFCPISIRVYPTDDYYNQYRTSMPFVMTFTVAAVFLFTICLLLFYNHLVERRQNLVLYKALQSRAIVSSLFPQNVADKLLGEESDSGDSAVSNNKKLKSFLTSGTTALSALPNDSPIAELFANATVLFGDINGFTAWSSSREPTHVFILLQSVYQAFDAIAVRRRVFKVETIGDCYMAVTGVPEPQKDHAIIMARFAVECQRKMSELANDLSPKLGPDTSELSMRMGMHSGPVTAGVLRGERARFQLFGDTVNTASRMESTGIKKQIQISEATAKLIVAAGKAHWVSPREDQISAKGKGFLKTFWLHPNVSGSAKSTFNISGTVTSTTSISTSSGSANVPSDVEEFGNLKGITSVNFDLLQVDWMCELLLKHIKKLIATRNEERPKPITPSHSQISIGDVAAPIDEVVEAIVLPEFKGIGTMPVSSVDVSSVVVQQLHDFISTVASAYRNNPFHNFAHACHVTMSVSKLLMRIVSPDLEVTGLDSAALAHHFHDYSNGINSDQITILAVLFAALIHDVDHQGISNNRLMEEDEPLAIMYGRKSVAEQNSIDISWRLLMSEQFEALRNCMFASIDELKRFRQVLVNVVLATDIFDKELNDLRRKRWDKAFSNATDHFCVEHRNLRATIVLEHLIQASDVSHTMQHWQVYRKWNKKLFTEMYVAYRNGRTALNPGDFWYNGELAFFDHYIIPLAKKLKECQVFGVSSDEYLNYAEKNRAEWEACGQEIVSDMMNDMSAFVVDDDDDDDDSLAETNFYDNRNDDC